MAVRGLAPSTGRPGQAGLVERAGRFCSRGVTCQPTGFRLRRKLSCRAAETGLAGSCRGKHNHGDRLGLFRISVGMVRKIGVIESYVRDG